MLFMIIIGKKHFINSPTVEYRGWMQLRCLTAYRSATGRSIVLLIFRSITCHYYYHVVTMQINVLIVFINIITLFSNTFSLVGVWLDTL